MSSKVSVIVLNWNGKKWLEKCLCSILKQNIDEGLKVLLVDNGSTDDSVRYVQHRFPQVEILELGRNYGFAEGNNRALEYAEGEYLVFVNMDTEAKNGWLKNIVTAADEHPEYQVLCSIQIPSQKRNKIRTLNAFGNPMSSPYESESAITDSLFASGACFLIRRIWLDRIGQLFDPHYYCYAEDLELSLRTILLGGKIGYVRDSRIYHYVGGAGMPSLRASYLSTRNILLTYYKLFRLENFAKIFLVRIAYILSRVFARRDQTLSTIGMMKGVMGFLSDYRHYINYRKAFAAKKRKGDEYIFQRFLYRGRMGRMILRNFYLRARIER